MQQSQNPLVPTTFRCSPLIGGVEYAHKEIPREWIVMEALLILPLLLLVLPIAVPVMVWTTLAVLHTPNK
jgi:hypothetical protein